MIDYNQLFLILAIMLSIVLVNVLADPPYTYTEGEFGQGDAVFVNCTINIKGIIHRQLEATAPFQTETKGAFITYISVDNLKPNGQQATISKIDGGLNKDHVTFKLVSAPGHGYWFQFYIYGRTPLGTFENPLTGSCMKK